MQLVDVYVKRKFRLPSMNCDPRVYGIVSKCWDLDPHTRPSFDMLSKEMGALYNMVLSAATNPTQATATATAASPSSSSFASGSSSLTPTSAPQSSSNPTPISTGSTHISTSSTSMSAQSSATYSNSAPSIHHPTTVSVPTLLSHLNSGPSPSLHTSSHMLTHHNSVAPPTIMT